MASLSLSLFHLTNPSTLSTLLHSKAPKPQSLVLVPSSSQSQFYGLKCSSTTSGSTPQSHFPKFSIFAKVTKGKSPPPFTLMDQDGRNVSLSKFKGKPVVVYFYPADESPGCTKQAMNDYVADSVISEGKVHSYENFKKAGAEVVGISGDSTDSHKAFAKKYKLPYTLLSDEGNKIRNEWGVPSDLFGALAGRETYVLDKTGVVQLVYNNQFQPEKHIDETLKLLQSLK